MCLTIVFTRTILILFWVIFSTKLELCSGKKAEYWDKNFDQGQDCENKEEILRLSKLQPSRCESISIIHGDQKALSDCKILLTIHLQKICDFSRKALFGISILL